MIIKLATPPLPTFCAKTAAMQPSPPPNTVPIPRFKPFPSVAPAS